MEIRPLEKGFGTLPLRTSTFVVLIVNIVVAICILLTVVFKLEFFNLIFTLLWKGIIIAVYGYTLHTLHHGQSSMLLPAFVALCVDTVFLMLGTVLTLFSIILSFNFFGLVFGILLILFQLYSIWIVHSYNVEFKEPVGVSA